MKTALSVAIVLALAAGPVLAKTAYCTDPASHKRISCKVAAKAAPVKAAPMATAKPVAKPGLFAKKPTVAPIAKSVASKSAGTTVHKGKKCGKSYIAANRACHRA
jgi:hypothetical protein